VPADELGHSFARLFEGSSITVEPVADFASVAWRKLCGNAAGIINTLIRKPAGAVRDDDVAELVRAVARAEGAVLPDDIAERIVSGARSAPPDALNSLQADREAGRPLELDARNGIILRLARKHGIPVPHNAMAVTLLAASLRDQPRS
jgi:2-dehydropantoate 2-reductase